jgi:hypothetical protein
MSEKTTLSPAAQARYDAAPAWMQQASYIDWEQDPNEAVAKQVRHMDAHRDPRKVAARKGR